MIKSFSKLFKNLILNIGSNNLALSSLGLALSQSIWISSLTRWKKILIDCGSHIVVGWILYEVIGLILNSLQICNTLLVSRCTLLIDSISLLISSIAFLIGRTLLIIRNCLSDRSWKILNRVLNRNGILEIVCHFKRSRINFNFLKDG